MSWRRKAPEYRRGGESRALPVLSPGFASASADEQPVPVRPRRNYGRWRAATLTLVYVLFVVHVIHWKLTGKTLAPLELNEVMYTLELGIVTAGFLFMCVALLGTLIFGRFFCSWGCHILALQDLCAWLLRKMGLRPKPLRSRILVFVPALVALYMFVWPQVARLVEGRPPPLLHLTTDAEGWASFVTSDMWRNLPGPGVAALTFLVCGFAIVYVLGSRSFCTYACPYGAIFALADRFAPGSIRVNTNCEQCATCTATCTCGIRVHEEVARHGMVVNPACLKDLDCVAACPHDALHYGFGKPSLFKSYTSGGRFGRHFDFSRYEDALMAVVFVATLLIFRGLYGLVPFLMTLGLGGILACLTVLAVRLWTRPHVRLGPLRFKQRGAVTRTGVAYGTVFAVIVVFVCHSAFVRYHEFRGLGYFDAIAEQVDDGAHDPATALAHTHLLAADRWGLFRNEHVERRLLDTATRLGQFDRVETYARRVLQRAPHEITPRAHLAQALLFQRRWAEAEHEFRAVLTGSDVPDRMRAAARQGIASTLVARRDYSGAVRELRAALKLASGRAAAHAELGSAYAELGRFHDAVAELREAVRLDPRLVRAHYNLGTLLAHRGRFTEAAASYEQALRHGADDADTHNNFGFALMRTGQIERAEQQFQRAIAINPQNADAHFNLARLYAARDDTKRAGEHYETATRLDPRYRQVAPPPTP